MTLAELNLEVDTQHKTSGTSLLYAGSPCLLWCCKPCGAVLAAAAAWGGTRPIWAACSPASRRRRSALPSGAETLGSSRRRGCPAAAHCSLACQLGLGSQKFGSIPLILGKFGELSQQPSVGSFSAHTCVRNSARPCFWPQAAHAAPASSTLHQVSRLADGGVGRAAAAPSGVWGLRIRYIGSCTGSVLGRPALSGEQQAAPRQHATFSSSAAMFLVSR